MKTAMFIISLLFFSSCYKSERTKASPEFFVGTWKWEYSLVYDYDVSFNQHYLKDTIYPNFSNEIKIQKNGNIKFYEKGVKTSSIRGNSVSYKVEQKSHSYSSVSPELNSMNGNYAKIFIYSFLKSDTILVFGYPYSDQGSSYYNEISQQNINNSGVLVYNYFLRQQ
jgi:hypothetical protein